jgi:hypothetical protein
MQSRYAFAALAYLVPTFPLGYFWHLDWFHAEYERLAMFRDEVIIAFGLLAMILQAALFSWMYPRLFDTSRGAWPRSAASFFGTFGTLAWSLAVIPVAAKYRTTSVTDFLALETAFTALQFAVVAPLIALAHRGPQRAS